MARKKTKKKLALGQRFEHPDSGRVATVKGYDQAEVRFEVERSVVDRSSGDVDTETRERKVPVERLRSFLLPYRLQR